jgi:trehalose 6-phosphate phosphatase
MGSEEQQALLAPLRERPDRAGVFSDFDGTLAPIVDDPIQARPLPGAAALLRSLAARYARVGVISGRPVTFLRQALDSEGLLLYGLYGLERQRGGDVVVDPDVEAWRPVVAEAAARAERADTAAIVERKGLSVVLHFRTAPARASGARRWVEEEAARTGLAVLESRKAFELRPPVPADKGTALVDAAAGLAAVCFLGDDAGDLAAFDALDELAGAGVDSLRIAVRSEEMPEDLRRRADMVVDGPEGARDLLEALL